MALNRFIRHENTLFFMPALQEGDHHAVVGHLSSSMDIADGPVGVNIPKDCNCVLAQAVDQDINYTISGTDPSEVSGFVLIAGNDPIAIPIDPARTVLTFAASADAARLELQFGII